MNIVRSSNFAKINALGNEILVFDMEHIKKFSIVFNSFLNSKDIYFEQMMVICKSKTNTYNFELSIYNNDGSKAGACGNGMRAVMQYVYYKYNLKIASFMTSQGRYLSCEYINDEKILVNMAKPQFDNMSLGLSDNIKDIDNVKLDTDLPPASLVSVGNPHAIFFLDTIPSLEMVIKKGTLLEKHILFKDRCNISFAKVKNKNYIKLRTWERGAGLTKACGSAACATHIAAFKKGLCSNKSSIELLGGELTINWSLGHDIIMIGPSMINFFGKIDINGSIIKYE